MSLRYKSARYILMIIEMSHLLDIIQFILDKDTFRDVGICYTFN